MKKLPVWNRASFLSPRPCLDPVGRDAGWRGSHWAAREGASPLLPGTSRVLES